ncbi:MAG: 50S ribosomal protein L25/general stress protein Ctc [Alphaproteobacteria bacterium]
MSNNYALKAESRDRAGKGVARSLRRENKVPAVVYGDAKAPVKISLTSKETNMEFNKGHMFTTICDLELDGAKHLVLARDVQIHPVTDRVEHIDFLRVTAKTKIAVKVPVHFINEDQSPGLTADKGVLNVVRHEAELLCSAMNIPEEIVFDLTGKKIGDAVRINEGKLGDAVPADRSRNYVIATLQAPKQFVEEVIVAPVSDAEVAAADAAAAGTEGAAPAAADAKAGDAKAAAAPKKEEAKK